MLGETGGGHPTRAIGLLAVNSSQPEVILAVVWRERNCFLARGDATVPFAQRGVGAAHQVVRQCVVRVLGEVRMKNVKRLVHVAGGDQRWRALIGARQSGRHRNEKQYESEKERSSHLPTTLTERPSRRGLLLVDP